MFSSSRTTTLATSDSFATSDHSTQNINHFEESDLNSTELHHANALKSDNDQALPSDVLDEFSKPSDQLEEEALVESRTQGAEIEIENVIERNEFSKEKVNENIDTSGITEAILLDSISTNSGING